MNPEERLRRELARASADLALVGVDLNQVRTRGQRVRRRRIIAMVATAGAAVALAIVGFVALTGTDRGPRPRFPAGTPSTSPTESKPPARTPSIDDVEAVLREWLQAIQDGDEVHAWSLLTPEAQAVIGRATFDLMMASALPEGLGAFADAVDYHDFVVPLEGDEARAIAVLSGNVTREGTTEFAAMAIPMRVRDGETLVDDHFDRARYYDRIAEFASASLGPQRYHAGDELTVEFARAEGATDVVIAVDGRVLPTDFEAGRGSAAATLDRNLEAGDHIATVVVLHRSGRLYPEAIPFGAAP